MKEQKTEKRILQALGQINEDMIAEAAPTDRKSRKMFFVRVSAAAACLLLLAAGGIYTASVRGNTLPLGEASHGVTARYTKSVPDTKQSYSLVPLTEQELFARFDTAVLKGTVTKIDNIVLDFNGEKDYRAIAQIQIEKVWRGDCRENEIISVLLPCPIQDDFWVEDTETVAELRVGMTGIFMPMVYDGDDFHIENGAQLLLSDIAPYGFADGSRYAFLETENGLVFARGAYESIADAQTLSEIEDYVAEMAAKTE